MAKLLLDVGQCSVDPLNNRRQTPLLLAVSQGHAPLVELLAASGADVGAADEDGNTAVHGACLKLHTLQGQASRATAPNIFHVSCPFPLRALVFDTSMLWCSTSRVVFF